MLDLLFVRVLYRHVFVQVVLSRSQLIWFLDVTEQIYQFVESINEIIEKS